MQNAIAQPGGTVSFFFNAGNTYDYDHVTTGLSTTGDAMVELVGIHPIVNFIAATHTIIF